MLGGCKRIHKEEFNFMLGIVWCGMKKKGVNLWRNYAFQLGLVDSFMNINGSCRRTTKRWNLWLLSKLNHYWNQFWWALKALWMETKSSIQNQLCTTLWGRIYFALESILMWFWSTLETLLIVLKNCWESILIGSKSTLDVLIQIENKTIR